MQVVAASVHLAGVAGGKGQAGFFLNWQRVHVAAQHEALAFLRAKLCQYARAVDDGGVGDAHLVQLLLYKGAGLRQLQSQTLGSVDESRQHHHRRPVLIVVEHGNVQRFDETAPYDLEAPGTPKYPPD